MANLGAILARAVEMGASDVHINAEMPPIARVNTELVSMVFPVITDEDAKEMVSEILGKDKLKKFKENKDIDLSITIGDEHRFRVNIHYQRGTIAISFRVIPNQISSIDDLNLPQIIKKLTDLPRGLILITGHAGAGKSSTLAAMIDLINSKYKKRIITLEDPVEYLLKNKMSMIEQREIGSDCPNFAFGLKHILRQDPDIIMVGEMRDIETTSATITAAETGHLVLSTLHTINAPQTIERIIDIYPADQQNQIRTMLANTLQAVVSQTLCSRIDESGMVPCTEILLCTSAVKNCIRENRIYEIPNIIETSSKLGMHNMDKSIGHLYSAGFINREDAIMKSSTGEKLEKMLISDLS